MRRFYRLLTEEPVLDVARLLLLLAGGTIARAGARLQALALKGAGIVPARKPPHRAEEPAPPAWRMPNAGELDYARACMRADPNPIANHIFICRGPGKGCTRRTMDECPDCYRVPWCDQRSSAEVLAAMERGDG